MAARPDRVPRSVPELQTLKPPGEYSYPQIRLAIDIFLILGRGDFMYLMPPEGNGDAEG